MIKNYRFYTVRNALIEPKFYVNSHKVNSAVYTMMYYKVSGHVNYKRVCKMTNHIEMENNYYNSSIIEEYERKN